MKSRLEKRNSNHACVTNIFTEFRIWSWHVLTLDRACTHGFKKLHTLLLKTYNDNLERQSFGRLRCEVTFIFGTKYTDLQQKITSDTSCGMSQNFHCNRVTSMKSLWHSTARVGCDFLLQIGILSAKGITKNVANLEVRGPTPDPLTTLSVNLVIS